ncbi:hypothetical protein ANCDUO_10958 [Ancylostoma duodenale]|uniref:Uncharacterized protein n=1 Tax=Ancylostoma duodenale TaxID=51022 RepID=A0A0C2GIZ2_9BILA|nr:hypothetical protein ANCDUO_10958 [Ancylostoma duodenale]
MQNKKPKAFQLFETLRQQKNGRHLFLLDYDKRFAHFYLARQFGQYSMLVDHFYDAKTATRLSNFFAVSSVGDGSVTPLRVTD